MTSSTSQQQRNFLGIPIEGHVRERDSGFKPQRPIEEFQAYVLNVLDFPEVHDFGWRQFTPYFNDGEPCVFHGYGFWLRTAADVDPERDLEEDISEERFEVDYGEHPSLGKRLSRWDHAVQHGGASEGDYVGSNQQLYDAAQQLSAAIGGGSFDAVLLERFGDHASVHVTRERIIVDTYEHD